jgi:hypothetical protein
VGFLLGYPVTDHLWSLGFLPLQCSIDGYVRPKKIDRSWNWSQIFALVKAIVLDVVIPLGVYFLVGKAGCSNTVSLVISGSIPASRTIWAAVHGRLEPLAALVMGLFVVSLILLLITGNPRFLLMKEAFASSGIGVWCLFTSSSKKPLTYYTARLALTRGNGRALRSWSRLNNDSVEFRSIQRRLSILWGIALICEACCRVVVALTFPLKTAVIAVYAPAAGIFTCVAYCHPANGGLENASNV